MARFRQFRGVPDGNPVSAVAPWHRKKPRTVSLVQGGLQNRRHVAERTPLLQSLRICHCMSSVNHNVVNLPLGRGGERDLGLMAGSHARSGPRPVGSRGTRRDPLSAPHIHARNGASRLSRCRSTAPSLHQSTRLQLLTLANHG